jgi:hypothetical protein
VYTDVLLEIRKGSHSNGQNVDGNMLLMSILNICFRGCGLGSSGSLHGTAAGFYEILESIRCH